MTSLRTVYNPESSDTLNRIHKKQRRRHNTSEGHGKSKIRRQGRMVGLGKTWNVLGVFSRNRNSGCHDTKWIPRTIKYVFLIPEFHVI